GAADLERPHGLQELELEPDLRIGVDVEPYEGRSHRQPLEHSPRALDLCHLDHSGTTAPTPSSSARLTTCSAAARSSTASPSDLNTVISSGVLRPCAVPSRSSPIS